MIAIVFLDASDGMAFHHRRQSRDRAVTERIQTICQGKKLWMHPDSVSLYGALSGVFIFPDEAFLAKAGDGEYCLIEQEQLYPHLDRLTQVIVFRWNRKYPADVSFDLDLSKWEKISTREFPGFSHERITEEIFGKGEKQNI